MTERFIVDTAGTLVDMVTRDTFDYVSDVVGLLNGYDKENERLKNMVRHSYVEHKRCVNNYVDKIKEVEKENEQLKQFKEKVFKLIDDNIQIYEDTTTNDEFLQIQLDTKLQTLYNLRKELN